MDGQTLRTCVWEEMLTADMRSNYFAELVRHYLLFDKALRVATLIAASGAVGTTLSQSGTEAKLIAPILATAGSFWLLVSQYGSMARDASDLHAGWSIVARDYERLWNGLDSPGSEAKYHEIYDRAEELSRSGVKFPNKKARLNYWLDQAATMATGRYA
jgi:hypothetical protein